MRNMSFFLTTKQYRNRTKTVTRRLGWWSVQAGDQFMGVVKGQGIPKGGKVEKLHASEVVSARTERLDAIDEEDVIREGFLHLTPDEFVKMFCEHNGCQPWTLVNRIEFKHL